MKWIPIYGMFTKDINNIPDTVDGNQLGFWLSIYHAFWFARVILLIIEQIIKS